MFFDRLAKLLNNVFKPAPKYITVSVAQATAGPSPALPPSKLPRHVAIIMDGNGRWAQGRGLPRSAGHAAGTEALRDIIRASDDWGIEALSLYAFSTENWARSKDEVNALMGLLLKYFNSEIDELDEKNVRITILGDVNGLPEAQRDAVCRAMERTKDNTGLKLNIALNYGGRAELTRAARLLAEKVKAGELEPEAIDEALFARQLYTADSPDVDLLIRTSGEMRTSNFLPWQLTYAEMVFDSVNWPDFDRARYLRCLRVYAERDRRFGSVDAPDGSGRADASAEAPATADTTVADEAGANASAAAATEPAVATEPDGEIAAEAEPVANTESGGEIEDAPEPDITAEPDGEITAEQEPQAPAGAKAVPSDPEGETAEESAAEAPAECASKENDA